ncbi:Gfo/Idh/MocA family oxidoreductase [bacterium SCSIO 12696]|nr:Gfo/Idh/MocA family oxidoreductase [bacterium SCSIO 12696]
MNNSEEMSVAIVGCGFVADYYMATIEHYPHINIAGVFDIDTKRLKTFCDFYQLDAYESFEAILANSNINIVLNLTDPRSHYEVSKQCLEKGKNVYSEKPLAMSYEDAKELVCLAEKKGLHIHSAPCSLFGNLAQTLKSAVSGKVCGDIRLVYAELDDGMIHKQPYKMWVSKSGAPWPYKDEFEVGCTLEHAGYYLTWLVAMFGRVEKVIAFSDCLIKEKVHDQELTPKYTADTSLATLVFSEGVVARLSTTIVAPSKRSLQVIGEKGVLEVDDCWNNNGSVYFRRLITIRRKTFLSPIRKKLKSVCGEKMPTTSSGKTKMDFLLGVDGLRRTVLGERSKADSQFALHVNEVALALQYSGRDGVLYRPESELSSHCKK